MKTFLGLLVVLMCLCGCVQPTKSTGFFHDKPRQNLPATVPSRVAVFIDGRPALALQAQELFSTGLTELGFDVMEREKVNVLTGEIALAQQGFVSNSTALSKGEFTGVDGVFIGSASGETSPMWTDTHVSVRLVQARTGKTIWSVNASDPRLLSVSMSEETSIIYSTKAALKALKRDLATLNR